jgi:hypothetical protein
MSSEIPFQILIDFLFSLDAEAYIISSCDQFIAHITLECASFIVLNISNLYSFYLLKIKICLSLVHANKY